MMKTPVLPMKSRLAETHVASSRRRSHGSTAWASDTSLNQPQDGALDFRSRVASIASRLHPAMPCEAEDARLTGSTRNLFRRLMGLNVAKIVEPIKPATALMLRRPNLAVLRSVGEQAQVA